MFKTIEHYWGNLVAWDKQDKQMVKDVILRIYNDMDYPAGLEPKLSRIYWSRAYVKHNFLFIEISVAFDGKIDLRYSYWQYYYSSQRTLLAIPYSEFRDYKLDEFFKNI